MLGAGYGGGTGAELGRLVVYLAPWMVVSVALDGRLPAACSCGGRARWLPLLAAAALGVQVLVEWGARALRARPAWPAGWGRRRPLVLVVLLVSLGALAGVARGIVVAAVVCGGLAAIAFVLPRLVVGPVAAAAIGVVLYAAVLALWRPPGLRARVGVRAGVAVALPPCGA